MMERKSSRRTGSARGVERPRVPEHSVELICTLAGLVAPPPILTVSQWADEYRILPETAAEPGPWSTDRTPYLREPMDAFTDPDVRKVVLKFAVQLGKTEVLLNYVGYLIHNDPSTIIMLEPTEQLAMDYSKERLSPMLKDVPVLSEIMPPAKAKDSENTILRKYFPGGFIVMVGANSPVGLAARPARVLLADEVDRYPPSAGSEGSPLPLAEKRQTTFWNRKTVLTSTPTDETSTIHAEYERSSQEEWFVECPSCGSLNTYEWGRLDFETVCMACSSCGELHGERQWKAQPGRWVRRAEADRLGLQSRQPGHAEREEKALDVTDVRGFHLNAMASPWLTWENLIQEWQDAQGDPEDLKVFINTRLAEIWREEGEEVGAEILEERRHYYDCDAPSEVLLLTAGVDVQADRLELEVVGWGEGLQSWGIHYQVIPGDPCKGDVWQKLDEALAGTYRREDGSLLPISCTAVDSGYATSDVYAYTKKRLARYIFAIKGQGGPGHPIVNAAKRQDKNKDVYLFPVGTDQAKDAILSSLGTEHEGPGYCHWPREHELSDGRLRGYGEEYFKGLTAEHRVERKRLGQLYHVWVKKHSRIRNEALDCRVYALAAIKILGPNWMKRGSAVKSERAAGAAPRTRGRRQLSKGVQV